MDLSLLKSSALHEGGPQEQRRGLPPQADQGAGGLLQGAEWFDTP
jgi:hypothetical protein